MKVFWIIVAGCCMVTAALFLLRNDLDKAFVIAALGMLAWFLNYRAQMKDLIAAAERQKSNEGEEILEDSDNEQ